MTLILFVCLAKKVNLIPPNFGDLQFGRFLKNGTSDAYSLINIYAQTPKIY